MTKLTLTDVANLQNESTAVTTLASNNAATIVALENTLSRDGTTPNHMNADFDMNSNRIINLPDALTDQEPATYGQLISGMSATSAGAVVDASYITLSNDSLLNNERVLTAGNHISFNDAGPGGTLIVDVNETTLNADPATLTNKTIDLASNTLTGTRAQFNTALSDDDFATLTGSETLTNKTLTAPVMTAPVLGTPASGTLTNATGLPISTGVSGLGTGVATFLATPSSANLRSALTDEVGTGAAYFVGGALGTPASATLTNATGLPLTTGVTGNLPLSNIATQAAYTFVGNNTSGSAVPTAVDIAALTTKGTPASGDYVILSDQAASGAWKKATVTSLTGASGVSSIAGNTGAFTLSNGITNSTNDIRLATIAAGSVLGNNTTSTAIPSAVQVPVLLNTLTASSSATLSDTTSFTSTYSAYELVFIDLIPATNTVTAQLQIHSGGSFRTSGYLTQSYIPNVTGIVSSAPTTYIGLSHTSSALNAAPGISGTARIANPSASAVHAVWGMTHQTSTGPSSYTCTFSGWWNTAAAITGFQFLFSSGNITSGMIKVYGIP